MPAPQNSLFPTNIHGFLFRGLLEESEMFRGPASPGAQDPTYLLFKILEVPMTRLWKTEDSGGGSDNTQNARIIGGLRESRETRLQWATPAMGSCPSREMGSG